MLLMKITVFWDMSPCRMIFNGGLRVLIFFLPFFNFLTLFVTFVSFSPSFSVSPVSPYFCCPLHWCVKPTVLLTSQHNLSLAFLRQSPKMFFILAYGKVSSKQLSFSTLLKMEVGNFSETLIINYQATRHFVSFR